MTTVLLTATQMERFGHRYRDALPDGRFLELHPDGSITGPDGSAVEHADAVADVAFGSTDLFDGADQNVDAQRHFFGWLLQTSGLEWFHIAAAGVDHPIFGSLLDQGIRLTTSHHTAIPISEYVLAQVLRARLPLDTMEADRQARRWQHAEWDEVSDSRWMVIGLGAIGQAVASRARAFGATVTGVRRTPTGIEPCDRVIGPGDVHAALPDHDVIVLAAPATTATVGMVDAAFLAALPAKAILVNVGRGSLIDEDALRVSLDLGRPTKAILDVTAVEPTPADHWLWNHPSVVLTAHTASGGRQRYGRAADAFATNLRRFARGEPLLSEVTIETRDAPA